MSCQLSQRRFFVIRPPLKSALGQSFLTKPEPLPVVHEDLDGGCPFIAKNKNITGKRIARQNLSAYLRKPVDALAKIRGLNRQQYSHLRCNLDHDRNAFSTVSIAGGCPLPVTHRRLPSERSHSICHRLATAPKSISINCSGEWGSSGILFLRSA